MRIPPRLIELGRAARRRRGLLLAVALILALGPPIAFGIWTWRTVAGVDLSRGEDAALIYAAGQVLAPGVSVEAADLQGALRRLGYREIRAASPGPGQFRRESALWEVHLRPRDDPRSTRGRRCTSQRAASRRNCPGPGLAAWVSRYPRRRSAP